jgi:hypothetical protein
MPAQWDFLSTLPNLHVPIPTPSERTGYVIWCGENPAEPLGTPAANAGGVAR